MKFTELLGTPATVTTTLPVMAPFGTDVDILVDDQLVAFAEMPLKVTVLVVPWLAPKFDPLIGGGFLGPLVSVSDP